MAAIWKGSLAFGLVNIPIELRTAVRADHISFRLLHEEDLSPVKYERVCQADGEPVPWNEIVKGYEYEKGKYVVMTDEDFKAAAIEGSKTIDIIDFVKEEEIDPRYFETPYYLVPAKNAEKSYALLREAIRTTGAVGIGKIIIRQTQHLAGIKVVGNALVLEIMRFSNERGERKRVHLSASRPGPSAGACNGRTAHRQPCGAFRSVEVHRRLSIEPDEDHQGEDEGEKAEARGAGGRGCRYGRARSNVQASRESRAGCTEKIRARKTRNTGTHPALQEICVAVSNRGDSISPRE
jgi:Ku protein